MKTYIYFSVLLVVLFTSCERVYDEAYVEILNVESELTYEHTSYAPDFFDDGVYTFRDGFYYDLYGNQYPNSQTIRTYSIGGSVLNTGELTAYDVDVVIHYTTDDGTSSSHTVYLGDIEDGNKGYFRESFGFTDKELIDYWAEVYWYN